MLFFVDNKTFTITTREFETNIEVLDNLLTPINENIESHILHIRPNNTLDFEAEIIKSGPLKSIFEQYTQLIKINPKAYVLVSFNDLNDYLEINNLKLIPRLPIINQTVATQNNKTLGSFTHTKAKTTIFDLNDIIAQTELQNNEKSDLPTTPISDVKIKRNRLIRSNESYTYIYKSPNKR